MLFSQRDIDLLMVLRWCRYASADDLSTFFSEESVTDMTRLNLIRVQKTTGTMILTQRGNTFLDATFPAIPKTVKLSNKPTEALRRAQRAKVMMTAYRAGLSVFATQLSQLEENAVYYVPTIMRGRGTNPWGNSRISAVIRLSDILAAVHYICPGIGDILLTDELHSFTNNTASIPRARPAMMFAGESYQSVMQELNRASAKEEGRLVSYGDAFRSCTLPIHLLSCDDTGATQLRIMAQPDYRRRLTVAALNSYYRPPPQEHPEWDAIFDGVPFVMAADMELRRIDAAIQSAKAAGFRQITMAALSGQVKSVLSIRYRVPGLARVFTLSANALNALGDMTLYTPSRRQYETPEGDVIDAPPIQADRKSGRQGRK